MKVSLKYLFVITVCVSVGLNADDQVIRYGNHISLKDYSGKYYSSTKGLTGDMLGWEIVNADPANQKNAEVTSGDKVFLKADSGKYLSARNDAEDYRISLVDDPKEWEAWIVNAEPGSTNQLTRQRKIWFTSAHGGRLHSGDGNVNAASGLSIHHSCGRFDIGCQITQFIQNNPVTNFVKDTANKVGDFVKSNIIDPANEKVVGPIREKARMVGSYATMGANVFGELADSITESVADIIGAKRKVCEDVSDNDIVCPAKVHTACHMEQSASSLSQKLADGSKTLNDTIASIKAAIADVEKQKQAVIAQKLDKKPITELKQLNTLLVGPNGAFDELKAALTSVVGNDGLGGLKAAFDVAQKEAVKGQDEINGNIDGLRESIEHPKTHGIPLGESLPSRFQHIASMFNW
jgi:hypothetical protein